MIIFSLSLFFFLVFAVYVDCGIYIYIYISVEGMKSHIPRPPGSNEFSPINQSDEKKKQELAATYSNIRSPENLVRKSEEKSVTALPRGSSSQEKRNKSPNSANLINPLLASPINSSGSFRLNGGMVSVPEIGKGKNLKENDASDSTAQGRISQRDSNLDSPFSAETKCMHSPSEMSRRDSTRFPSAVPSRKPVLRFSPRIKNKNVPPGSPMGVSLLAARKALGNQTDDNKNSSDNKTEMQSPLVDESQKPSSVPLPGDRGNCTTSYPRTNDDCFVKAGEAVSQQLRPVSRLGEVQNWNYAVKNESFDGIPSKRCSQSFRPYILFTKVSDQELDVISRGATPALPVDNDIREMGTEQVLPKNSVIDESKNEVSLKEDTVSSGANADEEETSALPVKKNLLLGKMETESTGFQHLSHRASIISSRQKIENANELGETLEVSKEWQYKVNSNEWMQIPVLFDLFTYLIQLHELQETVLDDEAEYQVFEEALSCLLLRISYSMYQVEGILLSSWYATWANQEHFQLVKNLTTTWKKGHESPEFQEASLKLLGTISSNCTSDVFFTRKYKLWRWIGSMSNKNIASCFTLLLGCGMAICICVLAFSDNRPEKIAIGIIGILLTFILTLWCLVFIDHNSYADASSSFFREDARSATQLEMYFGANDEDSEEELSFTAPPPRVNIQPSDSQQKASRPARGKDFLNIINPLFSFGSTVSSISERENEELIVQQSQKAEVQKSLTRQLSKLSNVGNSSIFFNHRESNEHDLLSGLQFSKNSGGVLSGKSRGGAAREDNLITFVSSTSSGRGSSPVHEEKRLKRSESKKYLFSRSTANANGTSSMANRVVALMLTPPHLVDGSSNFDAPPNPFSSDTREMDINDYDEMASCLQKKGFTILKFPTVGLLDEAFHTGANKANVIMLPLAVWESNLPMRSVFAGWIAHEHRNVFFFGINPPDEFEGTKSAALTSPSYGSINLLSARSQAGSETQVTSTQTLVGDPLPPSSTCVYLPLQESVSARLYQTAVDRGQSKKGIFHSYVPPYVLGSRLGGGAFGSVFECVLQETGTRCAVKRIQLNEENAEALLMAGVEEVELLSSLHHPNIIRYMYTERSGNTLSIFMERCGGGTLNSLLSSDAPLNATRVKTILSEIISTVAFLHIKLIIHRDLKPDNIIFHDDGSVRVIDFGSAGLRKDNFAKMEGTLAYMAPEVLLELPYGKECDVWSFGCVAADILGVSLPQRNLGFVDLHEFFSQMGEGPIISCGEPGIHRFLSRCLQRDPSKRAECIELLEDDILKPSSTVIANWLTAVAEKKKSAAVRNVCDLPSSSNMSLWSTQV